MPCGKSGKKGYKEDRKIKTMKAGTKIKAVSNIREKK